MSVKKCKKCGKMKVMSIYEKICPDCDGSRAKTYAEILENAAKKNPKMYKAEFLKFKNKTTY